MEVIIDWNIIFTRIWLVVTNLWVFTGIYMLLQFLKHNKEHKMSIKRLMVMFIIVGMFLMLASIWTRFLDIEVNNKFLRIILGL